MSLLRKIRVLVGALAHRPFMPRPEKVDLSQDREQPGEESQPEVADTERVADLLAQQQREEAD
jgi:hypothetical protein